MPKYRQYADNIFGAVVAYGAVSQEDFNEHVRFADEMDAKHLAMTARAALVGLNVIPDLADIAVSYLAGRPWRVTEFTNAFWASLPAAIRDVPASNNALNFYLANGQADVIVVADPAVAA